MISVSESLVNEINSFYSFLKNKYPVSMISEERQYELNTILTKYGYLPFPYIKALNELSDAEVLLCLEQKFKNEGVLQDGTFSFSNISVLARHNVQDTSWIKREAHDIKLINLLGLGDGNKNQSEIRFIDWLRQVVILPTGNLSNEIFNTTIYLTPFHPRGFGCAYIPQASCVDSLLEDKNILQEIGLNADVQVKMFIYLAQLAGHPVIYDILPQTGRYSKTVLANPSCVRWFDVSVLIKKICVALDKVWENTEQKILSQELIDKYSKEELQNAIAVYKKILTGESKLTITEGAKEIIKQIDKDINLKRYKKSLSQSMQKKQVQEFIQQKAKNVIQKCLKTNSVNIQESDIEDRAKVELALIKNGLWPLPGGAWNSAGVPVFDKMAKNALFPMMRHYNFKNEDVTKSANLDCQSPFYFVCLESGEYNEAVIEFFINHIKNIIVQFNFDGVRVDHVNHIIDELSVQEGVPISYRIPKTVLQKLNDELKTISPHFVTLAEYMLWDNFYRDYHEDMHFDILWGNDIPAQSYKTPIVIDTDNVNLSKYNHTLKNADFCSVLKTYNNQDGEYQYLDRFPAQLGRDGALFKWFKYKFFPGGYYAQRPVMYVDGDESFSKGGIEKTICNEVFMKRGEDYEFFAKFDAIDRFAKNNQIICYGEAHVLHCDDDGFVYWQIQNNNPNSTIMVVANYFAPQEKFYNEQEEKSEYKFAAPVKNKSIKLNEDYVFVSEYLFDGINFVEYEFANKVPILGFNQLLPAEFRFFRINKND